MRKSGLRPLAARASGVACLAVMVSLLLPSATLAGSQPAVGIFSDVRVAKGQVVHDDVVCIGGTATVEGTVEGDVVVIQGKLIFSGEARDVVTILSNAQFEPGATVRGDQVNLLGRLQLDPSVVVTGDSVDLGSKLPHGVQRVLSRGLIGLFIILRIVSVIISMILILLIALLAPNRLERMSHALEPRWPASLGFGFLGVIVVAVACILLAITLIGIPVAILLGLLAKVVGLMGVAAIMAVIGKKVGSGTGLTGPAPSVLATVAIGFVVVALVRFVPIIGELAWLVLSILGLGLALVTKLGSARVAAASGAPAPASMVP